MTSEVLAQGPYVATRGRVEQIYRYYREHTNACSQMKILL